MNGLIKPSYIIIAILTVLVAFMSVAMIKYDKQVKVLQGTIESQQGAINSLQVSINDISKIKAIQLAIYPHIENKVTSAFGNTKNVTLQYYFTIDGNNLKIQPDSIYTVNKIQ